VLWEIPYVRPYAGAAYTLATLINLAEPGLDRLQLAGLSATNALMPGTIKADSLARLKTKVEAHETALEAASAKKGI